MLVNVKFILLSVHLGTACDLYPTEVFSHFVTSMTATIATGWTENCRVELSPTGKRCLCTAHTLFGHSLKCSRVMLTPGFCTSAAGILVFLRDALNYASRHTDVGLCASVSPISLCLRSWRYRGSNPADASLSTENQGCSRQDSLITHPG